MNSLCPSTVAKSQELVRRIQIIPGMFLHLTIITFFQVTLNSYGFKAGFIFPSAKFSYLCVFYSFQFPAALLRCLKCTMDLKILTQTSPASGTGRKFRLHFRSHLIRFNLNTIFSVHPPLLLLNSHRRFDGANYTFLWCIFHRSALC